MLGITTIPIILVLILTPFIPESPRWLILNDRNKEAENVLARMCEFNGKPYLYENKILMTKYSGNTIAGKTSKKK